MAVCTLFLNQSTDATGTTFSLRGGSEYVVHVNGTFGSGTFKLEVVDKYGNATDVPNSSVTAEAVYKIELPSGTRVRGVLSGSTGASLDAYIDRL